jgi:hypothetical protein
LLLVGVLVAVAVVAEVEEVLEAFLWGQQPLLLALHTPLLLVLVVQRQQMLLEIMVAIQFLVHLLQLVAGLAVVEVQVVLT